jgi:Fe-S-cluster containining protein
MSDEVEAIAKATGRTFCEVDTKLNQYPCGYLDEKNLCSIHYIKPFCCKHYPRCDAYDNCPGYKELADKIYVEGAMHRVCNDKELSQLYTNVVLTGDLESAYKILDKLNIKL